ncbi:hypothetical protein FQZ97_1138960 [compost metagenome]
MVNADAHIAHLARGRDRLDVTRARQRIGFRHQLESHGAGVHPDAEDPLFLAHRRIVLRAFKRDDDVVLALRQQVRIEAIDRSEDRQVGAAEIRGDGDLVGRDADLQLFGEVVGILVLQLGESRNGESERQRCKGHMGETAHQKPNPADTTE